MRQKHERPKTVHVPHSQSFNRQVVQYDVLVCPFHAILEYCNVSRLADRICKMAEKRSAQNDTNASDSAFERCYCLTVAAAAKSNSQPIWSPRAA